MRTLVSTAILLPALLLASCQNTPSPENNETRPTSIPPPPVSETVPAGRLAATDRDVLELDTSGMRRESLRNIAYQGFTGDLEIASRDGTVRILTFSGTGANGFNEVMETIYLNSLGNPIFFQQFIRQAACPDLEGLACARETRIYFDDSAGPLAGFRRQKTLEDASNGNLDELPFQELTDLQEFAVSVPERIRFSWKRNRSPPLLTRTCSRIQNAPLGCPGPEAYPVWRLRPDSRRTALRSSRR